MKLIEKILGDPNDKELKKVRPLVDKINVLEDEFKVLSDVDLAGLTGVFRAELNDGKTLDDLLPRAFAAVREAGRRTLGMRHYDVQLIGGIELHKGNIAEMRTGEGKTLMATLPMYLNALPGKGAHLVTVNDYLAKRDAVWMGPVYAALGMTVGIIQHQTAFLFDAEYKAPAKEDKEEVTEEAGDELAESLVEVEMDFLRPVSRQEAYRADITYGTNNEFGFDYLRDNMVPRLELMVQRDLHFAIVDEVDSILIDEARTPLIISAPDTEPTDKYYQFVTLVGQLNEGDDYNVDEKLKAATLTDGGIAKLEQALGVENIYVERGIKDVHHIEQALRARTLYTKDKDYVVKDKEVIIVDEFTGRLMYGRRYSDGLHQAIEAKEGVPIQKESITMATITFQNLFRMYDKLSGMTGTAHTEAEEFYKIYGLDTFVIPTHRPVAREDSSDVIYKNEAGKLQAMVAEVKKRHKAGQPVLIGTVSIQKNELVSNALEKGGVPHEVLNAKNHEREAAIIAKAGAPGSVTVATNMAGRGVDIVLGGSPADPDTQQQVKDAGGLFVIGTERHESRRIDNQLRGRSGRQGDPGKTLFYVSMDDDLMRVFGSDRMRGMMERLGMPDDMPIEHKLISRSIEQAQKKVEGHNFDTRKHLVSYDDVINKHREVIYKKRRTVLENAAAIAKGEEVSGDDRESLEDIVLGYIDEELEQLVSFHTASGDESDWNLDEIYESADAMFPVPLDVRLKLEDIRGKAGSDAQDAQSRDALHSYLLDLAKKRFVELNESVDDPKVVNTVLANIVIRAIDTHWVEHIDAMDHLRTGIGLRGYGQRDPLVEYKKEAFRMFHQLQNNIQKEVAHAVFRVQESKEYYEGQKDKLTEGSAVYQAPQQLQGAAKTSDQVSGAFSSSGAPAAGESSTSARAVPSGMNVAGKPKNRDEEGKKVGRNDPCWCGSGIKYKKCGLINAPEHKSG